MPGKVGIICPARKSVLIRFFEIQSLRISVDVNRIISVLKAALELLSHIVEDTSDGL